MKTIKIFIVLAALAVFSGCQPDHSALANANRNLNSENLAQRSGADIENSGEKDSNLPASNQSETTAGGEKIESIYTDLASEKCKTLESNPDEGGSYRGECVGVSGYKLEVLEGDLRQTINVVKPDGKKSELELWNKVSSGFSALGDKAEWRVVRKGEDVKPFALIVRYNASENHEKPEQTTSYLVIVKIAKDSACVTDVVKPGKNQNEKARELADASAKKPCKQT